ncbi:methionine aminotransferase [Phaeodactylibacter luteus]|uniref:Aminotransferase class I/II-fold pyridoxal phosphate-dependent enzyme n=1 Tax=Phaeodactylibacter luteus TaxID=1564516 RepID=A0A5C6RKF9_9BACT|nr:methionine aminotransferase [Phaeodactylibacter luteus]TXB62868.1 aminotransferase class I/II-fold pyridoxal phosphate-dependent enzyme [Phaeodactylibacter luteus]
MLLTSKLPDVGTTIFSVMSALAQEHNAINLSQGFPNFPPDAQLIDRVSYYMREGYNQYAPMPGWPALRQALADKAALAYGQPVDWAEEVTITAGATQAIYCAIAATVRPGDEVILFEPAYDSYRPAVEVNGGIPVIYELRAPDYRVDWGMVESLITSATRMIIINTPHNPTGSTLKREDMLALQALTDGTDVLVLSDEVYEHLIYDGAAHQSALRFPGLRSRSFVTFSFGKTFHATGWKVGYCIAPPQLMAEFRKVHQYNTFSVHTPTQCALADYLRDPKHYEQLPAFYQAKRDLLLEQLEPSRFDALPCEGTYFCNFSYKSISKEPDTAFALRLIKEYGVAAIPVSAFYSSGKDEQVIRLCFAKTEGTLRAAAAALCRV